MKGKNEFQKLFVVCFTIYILFIYYKLIFKDIFNIQRNYYIFYFCN